MDGRTRQPPPRRWGLVYLALGLAFLVTRVNLLIDDPTKSDVSYYATSMYERELGRLRGVSVYVVHRQTARWQTAWQSRQPVRPGPRGFYEPPREEVEYP